MANTELFPLSSERQGGKDVKALVRLYTNQWPVFLVSILVCLLIAIIYIYVLSVPKYTVRSSILIKENAPVPTVSSFVTLRGTSNFDPLNSLATVIELLKSKALLRRTLNDLELITRYELDGKEIYSKDAPIKVIINKLDSTVYGRPFVVTIKTGNTFVLTDDTGKQASLKFGQQVKGPFGIITLVASSATASNINKDITIYFNNIDDLVNKYNEVLAVTPFTEKATLLQVKLIDEFPQRGEAIINKLLQLYEQESLYAKSQAIDNTIAFLDDRLKYFTKSLSGVERRVEEYKRRNELTDVNSQASSYVAQADAYTRNMSEWAIQIDILESIENYLNESPNQYKLVPSSLGIKDPTLLSLIGRLNELQLERENVLRTVKPNNPLVKNINEQIFNLRQNILENLKNIKNGLVIESENYKVNSEKFKSKVSKVPTMERDLLEINRQQSIRQNIYLYLLQKREEATIAKSAIVPDSEVVDSATTDPFPVSPKKLILCLVAVLLGIGLPFSYIFVKESLNDKIRSNEDIEKITLLPKIGQIPGFNKATLLNNRGQIVSEFDLIRAKLLYDEEYKKTKALLITSSKEGEGKTFTCVNLSICLALSGKKVVLLELNFRQPDLKNILNLQSSVGVSEYLLSDMHSIGDLIQYSDKISGLSVITAGESINNPSELLLSAKLSYLLEELKNSFDYIVIDTNSVDTVSDIYSLKSHIDRSFLIIRDNFTKEEDLINLVKVCQDNAISRPVIIFNGAAVKKEKKQNKSASSPKSKKKKAYI